MKKHPFGIFTGPNSFKNTDIFALREFETFQPNEVIATFSKSRFRDDGNGNDRESLGNRSRRPRQYSNTLAVICATATATTEALIKLSFKDLRELPAPVRTSVTLSLAKDLSF